MKKTRELSLKKKIEFCDHYLNKYRVRGTLDFICCSFDTFVCDEGICRRKPSESKFLILFPELKTMIDSVGNQLRTDWRWGVSWIQDGKIEERFMDDILRKYKITELKKELEKILQVK